MSLEAVAHRKIYPLEFYRKFLCQGVRPDGRKLTKCRSTVIKNNVIKNSDGSSIVKIGNTTVTCVINLEVTTPRSPAIKDGFIDINVELGSCKFSCLKYYNLYKKSIYNKELIYNECCSLSQQLTDLIISSKIFNLSSLCIESEKAVWILYCDLNILSNDGNIFDACLLSLVSSLQDLKIPETQMTTSLDSTITLIDGFHRLPLKHSLLPLTIGILDDQIIVDPTIDESQLLETCVTVVYDNDMDIVHLYKPGGNQVSIKDLQTIFKLGQQRAKQLLQLIPAISDQNLKQMKSTVPKE